MKSKLQKKGFTLIEVVAIVVILAIVSLIAIPNILSLVNKTRIHSIEDATKLLAKAAQDYWTEKQLEHTNVDMINLADETLDYDGTKPNIGYAYFDEYGHAYLKMYYNGYCITRNYDETIEYVEVEQSKCSITQIVTLTFDTNGGTGTVTSKQYNMDSTLGELPVPVREGYQFLGWYTEKNGGTKIIDSTVIKENKTVYARWSAKLIAITLDPRGGEVTDLGDYEYANDVLSKQIYYGELYGNLPVVSKEGYRFLGWSTAGGTEIDVGTAVYIPSEHTLYAQFEAITYTLTLNSNGGIFSPATGWIVTGTSATKQVIHGLAIGDLHEPLREGYIFAGYYTSVTDGEKITSAKVLYENATYFARWAAEQFVVTLNANGGSIPDSAAANGWVLLTMNTTNDTASKTIDYGSTLGVLPIPTREGYVFQGWSTLGGSKVTEEDVMTFTNDTTIYAQWSVIKYVVTFDYTGGSGSIDSKEVNYGGSYGTLPEPTKNGYTFQGWYTAASGGNKIESTTSVTKNSDHVIYAQWQSNSFILTLRAAGGKIPATNGYLVYTTSSTDDTATKTVTYGNKYTDLPTPTKTGYNFLGWYHTGKGEITNEDVIDINGAHELIAQWSVNGYTVTFDANGGEVSPISAIVNYGEKYGTLPTPTKSGYSFLGWYNSEDVRITSSTTMETASNHTITAKWQAMTYTLTLNASRGTIPATNGYVISTTTTTNDTAKKIINYNEPYGTLPTPTRKGYEFIGWGTMASGIIDANTVHNFTSDVIAYAQWEEKKYTVTFDGNGGTPGITSIEVQNDYAYGNLPNAVKKGYTFKGWFTASTGGSKITSSTIVNLTANQLLYAQYEVNTYTLTLNANNGTIPATNGYTALSDSLATKSISYGSKYGTLPTPTKAGNTFGGWMATNGSIITSTITVDSDSDITLYAQWEPLKYTITFNANGGSVSETTREVRFGDVYSTLPTPTKTGYDFTGWYNSSNNQIIVGSIVMVTENETFTAKWTAKTYTISFDSNGGTEVSNILVTYDSSYGGLPTPTKTGYNFGGWTTSGGSVITASSTVSIASNHTLYAQWTVRTFTITFDGKGGSVTPATTNVNFGSSYGSGTDGILPTPTREGYTFKGWYTAATSGSQVTASTLMQTASTHSIYAHWTANTYTITYVYNNGSSNTTAKVTYDGTYNNLPEPTKSGYTFLGWYMSDGSKIENTTKVKITSNQTLTGRWVQTNYVYNYTGAGQTFTATASGYYRLEVWGAQGGYSLNNGTTGTAGGYGGYAVGTIYVEAGTTLYIYVGGKGGNGVKLGTATGGYNGGGTGSSDGSDNEGSGGGGGATHIATADGLLSSLSSNKSSVIIVAGGGGGASWEYVNGSGGGMYGGYDVNGTSSSYPTQTSGYAFGKGQNGPTANTTDGVAGGGGGYYGGYSNNVEGKSAGTGGSGFIGYSMLMNKAMYCFNCTPTTVASTLTYVTECTSSSATEKCTKQGNGHAIIKFVGL